jgi:hypothetical protein
MKILDAANLKDLEKEKLSSLAAVFKYLSDAGRLERGQSTSNVAIKLVDISKYKTDNYSETED